jgi:heterotetrameric sarcosine oxidase gamma subunit
MPDTLTNPRGSIPSSARIVIVGGGVIGNSVAYHLAQMGCDDVVLLERDELTSGTTWHAAGLIVTYGSLSETTTEIRKYTRDLYARLEAETGQATGLRQCGFIEVATDTERLEEFRRAAAFNRYCGVDVEEISPSQVQDLFPIARVDDVLAGFYVADDGRVNPVDVTMALAKGAKMGGVNIITGVSATGVTRENGRATGVVTDQGTIACEYVVNCAGMWARQFGEEHGVAIPNQAAEHYYLITEAIPGISNDWPVLEDPANYGYYREEVGGLMVGLFEGIAAPWSVDGIPPGFSFGELEPDWERLTPYLESAMSRVPISMETGIKKFFCGPESFTPDMSPFIGEAPELQNYFVAAGMNSLGILSGGGVGRILAHWILNGQPDVDVTGFNIDRAHRFQSNPDFRRDRAQESLSLMYKCGFPTKAAETARNARRSALHHRLTAAGACFTETSGWESPAWFAASQETATEGDLSFGRMHWWPRWEAEHRACREGVILMDMSFMSKFLVQGRDAGEVLERVSANRVNGECGRITYTQWLNPDGLLEADLTVTKLEPDKFLVVVADNMHRHAQTWLERHITEDSCAVVTDVTGGLAQVNIQGPRSRELLQAVSSVDMSNEAFPFRAARDIDIGYGRALCIRITYVGELGYELYISSEQAVTVYDRLVDAGEEFGLVHAGLMALGSLRLEKGYRDYGHDIDNTDNAYETGLGFAVALGKEGGFIGREAAQAQKNAAPYDRRLVSVLVEDPEAILWHAEVIYRDDVAVAYVRAGSYGHTLGGAVGLAMIEPGETVSPEYLAQGRWEIEIADRRFPCRCSLQPLYDPEMKRIRA